MEAPVWAPHCLCSGIKVLHAELEAAEPVVPGTKFGSVHPTSKPAEYNSKEQIGVREGEMVDWSMSV